MPAEEVEEHAADGDLRAIRDMPPIEAMEQATGIADANAYLIYGEHATHKSDLGRRRARPHVRPTDRSLEPLQSSVIWRLRDGNVISCEEKLKVLNENLAEIRQICQDAFEDALLMGCDEEHIRAVFASVAASLENPFEQK